MRNRFISFTAVLLVLCFMAAVPAMAQRVVINAINDKPAEYIKPKPYDGEYDAHDLSGIWFRVGGDRSHGPARTNPPLTAAGIAEMKTHKPTRSNLPELLRRLPIRSNPTTRRPAATRKGIPRSRSTITTTTTRLLSFQTGFWNSGRKKAAFGDLAGRPAGSFGR